MVSSKSQVVSVTVRQLTKLQWLDVYNNSMTGDVPPARSDTQMIYDSAQGNMIIFGGWASRWYDDLYMCKVGEVVGIEAYESAAHA